MDGKHFDLFTRSFASPGISCRTLLTGTIGGLLALRASTTLAKPSADKAADKAVKEEEKAAAKADKACDGATDGLGCGAAGVCCGGTCLENDPRNCDACGYTCSGDDPCQGGRCSCVGYGGHADAYEFEGSTYSACTGGNAHHSYGPGQVCYTCNGFSQSGEGTDNGNDCSGGGVVVCNEDDPSCGPPATNENGVCQF